jgi:hypothetical protein
MKRNLVFALALISICACNNQSTSGPGSAKDDLSSNNEKILGIWTDSSSQNALFDIRKDSIYYIEQLQAFPYIVYRDTIKINFGDHVLTGTIRFHKDTMLIASEGVESKYWKYKQ